MSTQINLQTVDLDPASSAFLNAYIEAKAMIRQWEEKADIAAEQVKFALGDAEIGIVNGREAVRYTTVETRRLDTKRIREMLSEEQCANLETVTTSRRFVIVAE